ncbi:MAG: TolC family protein [Deltaproteobacteria bacterium]|nr:TolC family protein [Deltaproteobacteria bacterium]
MAFLLLISLFLGQTSTLKSESEIQSVHSKTGGGKSMKVGSVEKTENVTSGVKKLKEVKGDGVNNSKKLPFSKSIRNVAEGFAKGHPKPPKKILKNSGVVISLKKARLLAEKGNLDIRLLALKLRELEIEKSISRYRMYPIIKVESNAVLWNDKLEFKFSLPQEFNDFLAQVNPDLVVDIPPMLIRKQFTWQTSVTVAQPITPLLSLSHVHKMKKYEIDAQKMNIKVEGRKILDTVDQAWFNCKRAEKYLEVIIEAEKMLKVQEKRVKALIAAQYANFSDISRVKSAMADVHAQKIKAFAAIVMSRQYLAYILGKDPSKPLTVGEYQAISFKPLSVSGCLKHARKSRPEFKVIEMSSLQLRHAVKATEFDRIPRIVAVTQYKNSQGTGNLEPENQWFVGAMLSWEFQWKNKWRERDKLLLKKESISIMMEKASRGISLEINRGNQDIKTSRALVSARKTALDAARDSYEKTLKLSGSQMSTTTDVLSARLEVTKAAVNLINAEFDYRLSMEKYHRSCGF